MMISMVKLYHLFFIQIKECGDAGEVALPLDILVGFKLYGNSGDMYGSEPPLGITRDLVGIKGVDRRVAGGSRIRVHNRTRAWQNPLFALGCIHRV